MCMLSHESVLFTKKKKKKKICLKYQESDFLSLYLLLSQTRRDEHALNYTKRDSTGLPKFAVRQASLIVALSNIPGSTDTSKAPPRIEYRIK